MQSAAGSASPRARRRIRRQRDCRPEWFPDPSTRFSSWPPQRIHADRRPPSNRRRNDDLRDWAPTAVVTTPPLFGKRTGRPRAEVKDLRSITDPTAGSEARWYEGREAAHAWSGLSAKATSPCPSPAD